METDSDMSQDLFSNNFMEAMGRTYEDDEALVNSFFSPVPW